MAVNKVQRADGTNLIDISDSTVTPETLALDAIAYNAAGERIVGTGSIVQPPDLPPKDTFENMSWADIQTVCMAGYASKYWAIGDRKNVIIAGSTKFVCNIIGIDHDTVTKSAYGRKKAGITVQFLNTLNNTYVMNKSYTNEGAWADSFFRTSTVSEIMGYIESALTSVIVPVDKITGLGFYKNGLQTTSDSLFLLSESEVFGANNIQYSVQGEGDQYAYYAAGNSPQKKKGSTTEYVSYFLRSPVYSEKDFVVINNSGNLYSGSPNSYYYSAPAFCV